MIIGVDPSSSATGYAVINPKTGKLVEGGVVRKSRKLTGLRAIRAIIAELIPHLRKLAPSPVLVAVEIPTGRVYAKRHKGGGRGLAIYGMAAGMVLFALEAWVGEACVRAVTAEEWTDRGPEKRRPAIKAAYRVATDDGDTLDAVGIADWGLGFWRRMQA